MRGIGLRHRQAIPSRERQGKRRKHLALMLFDVEFVRRTMKTSGRGWTRSRMSSASRVLISRPSIDGRRLNVYYRWLAYMYMYLRAHPADHNNSPKKIVSPERKNHRSIVVNSTRPYIIKPELSKSSCKASGAKCSNVWVISESFICLYFF
jgi:hypothetical protein